MEARTLDQWLSLDIWIFVHGSFKGTAQLVVCPELFLFGKVSRAALSAIVGELR